MRSTADTALLAGGKALAAPVAFAAKEGRADRSAAVSVALSFNGAESLSFLPMGTDTSVKLAGNWPSPSFNGYRLPAEREVGKEGFTASWLAEESARPLPRVFFSGEDTSPAVMASAFGLDFLIATDVYLQAHRALRYGILFIFIPFAALFLFEALLKLRIHPVQYVLIGMADAVFYVLVLSLSEHMAFRIAYLVAAAAVTVLISLYALGAFKAARKTLLIIPAIAGQYAYLFFALESEDYALLTGTIGLFILIAVTMLATRRFDWYGGQAGPKRKNDAEGARPGSAALAGGPTLP
jgi:inner membrane protein